MQSLPQIMHILHWCMTNASLQRNPNTTVHLVQVGVLVGHIIGRKEVVGLATAKLDGQICVIYRAHCPTETRLRCHGLLAAVLAKRRGSQRGRFSLPVVEDEVGTAEFGKCDRHHGRLPV